MKNNSMISNYRAMKNVVLIGLKLYTFIVENVSFEVCGIVENTNMFFNGGANGET